MSSLRVIGPIGAIAIVAGSMVGIGIFLAPSLVAQAVASPAGFFAAWCVGGLVSLAGAVAYAQLGVRMPESGGDYVFIREAFGASVAFAAGWLLFAGVFVGSIAAVAVPLFEYQASTLVGRPLAEQALFGVPLSNMLGAVAIVVVTGANVLGTRVAASVQTAVAAVPIVLLVVAAGVVLAGAPLSEAAAASPSLGAGGVAGFVTALLATYFAYSGWNAVSYVAGELESPERTLPIGLLGGTVLITALYLLLGAAFVHAHGLAGVAGAGEIGTATAVLLGGERLGVLASGVIALALLSTMNATILAGARVAQAMAQSGALHPWLAGVSARFGTPARALVVQAVLAVALALSGTFSSLISLASLSMFLVGSLSVGALFVFRRRAGGMVGYTGPMHSAVFPALYLLVSVSVLASSSWGVLTNASGSEGFARWAPLLGLAVFGAVWLGHRVRAR